jgi:hypothetical protein
MLFNNVLSDTSVLLAIATLLDPELTGTSAPTIADSIALVHARGAKNANEGIIRPHERCERGEAGYEMTLARGIVAV